MRARLDSQALASARYDPLYCQLELEFHSGKRYLYFQVPQSCYEQLLQADSKGAFFNHFIRNRFSFQNLTTQPAPIVLVISKTK